MEQRINQIIELDECRRAALDQSLRHQESMKGTFDRSARLRSFQIGDTVLLWDKRREKPGKHGKAHLSSATRLAPILFSLTPWMEKY